MRHPPSTYAAIIGNSKTLCVLSHAGLPIRLFWPNIDYGQHIDQFRVGIAIDAGPNLLWLDETGWRHSQGYLETNVLETHSEHRRSKLAITSQAFAVPDSDYVVLTYQITSHRAKPCRIQFSLYGVIRIEESLYDNTSVFDEPNGTLAFYRRNAAIGMCSSRGVGGYQCGVVGEPSSALSGMDAGVLEGNKIQHKYPDGGVRWDLESVGTGESVRIDLFIALSHSLGDVLEKCRQVRDQKPSRLLSETQRYWREWAEADSSASKAPYPVVANIGPDRGEIATASRPTQPPTSNPAARRGAQRTAQSHKAFLDALGGQCGERAARVYLRSLLSLKLLSDRTGALIAAPEFDRGREVCGGYGYVWPRDGAFIAHSLDVAGKWAEAEAYFDWARRVQEPNGLWLHRYYCTGELAPSWGLVQIDETGAMIWSMAEHYRITGRQGGLEFLRDSWDSIERAAQHLAGALDLQTGLPLPSFDLWEEDFSESVYAAAATAGGLAAAAHSAQVLGKSAEGRDWTRLSDRIRSAIITELWDRKAKLFLRSINRRVPEETYWKKLQADGENYYTERPSDHLYPTFIERRDSRAESSVLGLVFPFAVFEPADPLIRQAVATLHRRLWCKRTGGIMRYEGDHYIGGNPWILTTLWLAIYYLEVGERKRAARLIRWASRHSTALDLLTEQVDRRTGEPTWAVPLGWSHAMFIIAARKLISPG
jgi:glucoamylase